LIDPREYYVELYRKQDDNRWVMLTFDKSDAVIEFKSIQMTFNLVDLYEYINFE